jgi:hypothetical protein
MCGGLGLSLGVCPGEIARSAPSSAGLARDVPALQAAVPRRGEDWFLMRWCV